MGPSTITTDRYYYTFNGQTIAQREYVVSTGVNTLKYLHGDQLGSVSLVTSSTGSSSGTQEFDPWGKVRSGGSVGTQTTMNFTGQKLDGTGLLNYNARMYDPTVGRFVSPDSIVPGASSGVGGAGGTVGAEQNSKLTVDFHESGFASSASGENVQTLAKGFWFQLSEQDQGKTNVFGPDNPQTLSRYAYVLDNPLRYVDPSGHWQVRHNWWGTTVRFNHKELRVILDNLSGILNWTKDGIMQLLTLLGAGDQIKNFLVKAGSLSEAVGALIGAGLGAMATALAAIGILALAAAAEYIVYDNLANAGGAVEIGYSLIGGLYERDWWWDVPDVPDGANFWSDEPTRPVCDPSSSVPCASPPPVPRP